MILFVPSRILQFSFSDADLHQRPSLCSYKVLLDHGEGQGTWEGAGNCLRRHISKFLTVE